MRRAGPAQLVGGPLDGTETRLDAPRLVVPLDDGVRHADEDVIHDALVRSFGGHQPYRCKMRVAVYVRTSRDAYTFDHETIQA